jgi:hypothetical protein
VLNISFNYINIILLSQITKKRLHGTHLDDNGKYQKLNPSDFVVGTAPIKASPSTKKLRVNEKKKSLLDNLDDENAIKEALYQEFLKKRNGTKAKTVVPPVTTSTQEPKENVLPPATSTISNDKAHQEVPAVTLPSSDTENSCTVDNLDGITIMSRRSPEQQQKKKEAEQQQQKKQGKNGKKRFASPIVVPFQKGVYEIERDKKVQKNQDRLRSLGFLKEDKSKKKNSITYNIEMFVGHEVRRGAWKLRTRWEGCGEEDDTWESLKEKRREVSELVDEYIQQHPELLRPPPQQASSRASKRLNRQGVSLPEDKVCATNLFISLICFIVYTLSIPKPRLLFLMAPTGR